MNLDELLGSIGQGIQSWHDSLAVRRAYRRLETEYRERAQSPAALRELDAEVTWLAEDESTQLLERQGIDDATSWWQGSIGKVDEHERQQRRAFLSHAAAVSVGAHVLGLTGSPFSALSEGEPPVTATHLDIDQVDRIEAAVATLERLFRTTGTAELPALQAVLTETLPLRHARGNDRARARVVSALAKLHNMAGWLAADQGSVDLARSHFGHALELARHIGNDILVAHVLCRVGQIYLRTEAPDDALKMFQLGQISAQQAGARLLTAVICGLQAWAYRLLGDTERVAKLFQRMHDELAEADHGAITLLNGPTTQAPLTVTHLAALVDIVVEQEVQQLACAKRLMCIDASREAG